MAVLQEPLQRFQGPSLTRARTKTDSITSQQSPCTRKRSFWKRGSRETKLFPCLRPHCRAKEGFPLPGPFSAGHSARRKGFSIDKQLTNSGHLTTVNQLQEVLKMRDSQGGKSKRNSCSDHRVKLCRLGRSSPITAHINPFEIICTCSWECCKRRCRQLRGEPCSVNEWQKTKPAKQSN